MLSAWAWFNTVLTHVAWQLSRGYINTAAPTPPHLILTRPLLAHCEWIAPKICEYIRLHGTLSVAVAHGEKLCWFSPAAQAHSPDLEKGESFLKVNPKVWFLKTPRAKVDYVVWNNVHHLIYSYRYRLIVIKETWHDDNQRCTVTKHNLLKYCTTHFHFIIYLFRWMLNMGSNNQPGCQSVHP